MEKKFTIKERIIQLAKYKGFTLEDFCSRIGLTYGNFKGNAKKTPINSDSLENILAIIPDVNPIWLLTGNGCMLLDNLTDDSQPKKPPNETASTCSLCLEKERIIKEMEARLQDKDKIIALLELQLSEYRAKEGERAIMAAAKSSSKLKPTVEKETVPK